MDASDKKDDGKRYARPNKIFWETFVGRDGKRRLRLRPDVDLEGTYMMDEAHAVEVLEGKRPFAYFSLVPDSAEWIARKASATGDK